MLASDDMQIGTADRRQRHLDDGVAHAGTGTFYFQHTVLVQSLKHISAHGFHRASPYIGC